MKKIDTTTKTWIGYIMIAVCLVLFCSLGISAFVLTESYDPETFCPDEILAHTVILLDLTDSLNKDQQKFVLSYINGEKNKLRDFEKLSVFTLTEDSYIVPESVFSKCSPGTGDNANELYQNPKKIRLKFDRFFSAPLKEVLVNIFPDRVDNRSPIFEMIRELSRKDDFQSDVPERTLIIISDMMHNTANYSHYKNRVDYEYFSETPYSDEVAAHLDSVDVKIVYLLRDNTCRIQGKRHLLCWEEYFQ